MISAVCVLNSRGSVLISRVYRHNVDAKNVAATFRNCVIAAKLEDRSPITAATGSVSMLTFVHIKWNSMFIVAVIRKNVHVALVLEFLEKFSGILHAYFGKEITEETIKENYMLVYEILDEILDFGYPQNTESDILRMYITGKSLPTEMRQGEIRQIINSVTGVNTWRKPGIMYKKNELFIDVIESVNFLLSANGNILHSDVNGRVMLKVFLSGMPDCKLGLNDRLMMQSERQVATATQRGRSTHAAPSAGSSSGNAPTAPSNRYREITIDDIRFHQCVRLGKFDSDRTITFTPPDGEFELMRYRITENVTPPFRVLSPIVRELGSLRVEVQVTVKSVFNARLFGKNVVVKIPVPPNTAQVRSHVTTGSAKYAAEQSAILWTVKKFPGDSEFSISAEVQLLASTKKKQWNRPPISLSFMVPMLTASGLHVRFLKVFEKSNYQAVKWVRYISEAGDYEVRPSA